MKKNIVYYCLQLFIVILFLTSLIYWGEAKNQNLSITVTVEPVRTIVVDRNLQITEIISNTKEDIRPIVLLDTQDGIELPYTDGIQQQYAILKPILNFSKSGLIYERDSRVTLAVFKTIISFIQKTFGISF